MEEENNKKIDNNNFESIEKQLQNLNLSKKPCAAPVDIYDSKSQYLSTFSQSTVSQYQHEYLSIQENTIKLEEGIQLIKEQINIQKGLVIIRKKLSVSLKPPIQQIFDSGIMQNLVQLFSNSQDLGELFEISWIFTNIASGDTHDVQKIRESGCVEQSIQILEQCQDPTLIEQILWLLGNIAGDSNSQRDYLISLNLHVYVTNLLSLILTKLQNSEYDTYSTLNSTTVWVLCNLVRGKPYGNIENTTKIIEITCQYLKLIDKQLKKDQTLIEKLGMNDLLWALHYILENDPKQSENIQTILNQNVTEQIIQCLLLNNTLALASIRVIGDMLMGDTAQCSQIVTQPNFFNNFYHILSDFTSENKGKYTNIVIKDIIFSCSNIASDSKQNCQEFLNHKDLFNLIIKIALQDNISLHIRKECAFVAANTLVFFSLQEVHDMGLQAQDIIQLMYKAIYLEYNSQNKILIQVGLEGLSYIFKHPEFSTQGPTPDSQKSFNVIDEFKEQKGFDRIETLYEQYDPNFEQLCFTLLENYDQEFEDQGILED